MKHSTRIRTQPADSPARRPISIATDPLLAATAGLAVLFGVIALVMALG